MDLQAVNTNPLLAQAATLAGPRPERTPPPAETPAVRAVAAVPQAQAATSVGADELREALDTINEVVHVHAANLSFSVDEDTRITVVKLIDSETDEVLRQIPSEEALQIAKALDRLQGLLVRDKA
ncbi:flagellar protein FlaG [Aromatoleum bremense]|uniref:Flagellar protein n=1 Tax=Aromatoleum bremense TaxID=76115 RepID=A0ABX1NZM7_9RHOO|nr:flagellar protein FlaG [Aromatoleum bremense]NMG17466.1 flagellar protein [Aromatoleum bremense]QTQ30852.1 Flagellar protein [Aromatoleum bremense]